MSESVKTLDPTGVKKFKFLSFADRIGLVDINPLYRSDFIGELAGSSTVNTTFQDSCNPKDVVCEIVIENDKFITLNGSNNPIINHNRVPTEADIERRIYQELKSSYFESALRYWKSRNLTREFSECYSQLRILCSSLPQIILHLSDIVKVLLEEIENNSSAAREPAYHLLAILSRDVRNELCPYLPSIFSRLISVLNPRDPNSIEYTFYTVGFFFRFLFRFILNDLQYYLPLYRPWLIHPVSYIRLFAAESLSFLIRKQQLSLLPNTLEILVALLNTDETENQTFVSNQTDQIDRSDIRNQDLPPSVQSATFMDSQEIESCSSDISLHGDDDNTLKLSEGVAFDKIQKQHNTDTIKHLAEAIGSVLFEIVKNVQQSYTGKLDGVIQFLFSLIDNQPWKEVIYVENIHLSDYQKQDIYWIMIRTFFIRSRNHTEDFKSESFQLLEKSILKKCYDCTQLCYESIEKISSDSLMNSQNQRYCKNLATPINQLLLTYRLVEDVAFLRPRPRSYPTHFVEEALNNLKIILTVFPKIIEIDHQQKTHHFIRLFAFCIKLFTNLWKNDSSLAIQSIFLKEKESFFLMLLKSLQIANDSLPLQTTNTVSCFLSFLYSVIHEGLESVDNPVILNHIILALQYIFLSPISLDTNNDEPIYFCSPSSIHRISIDLLTSVISLTIKLNIQIIKDFNWDLVINRSLRHCSVLFEQQDSLEMKQTLQLYIQDHNNDSNNGTVLLYYYFLQQYGDLLFTYINFFNHIVCIEQNEHSLIISSILASSDLFHLIVTKIFDQLSQVLFYTVTMLQPDKMNTTVSLLNNTPFTQSCPILNDLGKQMTSCLILFNRCINLVFRVGSSDAIMSTSFSSLGQLKINADTVGLTNDHIFKTVIHFWLTVELLFHNDTNSLLMFPEMFAQSCITERSKWTALLANTVLSILPHVSFNTDFSVTTDLVSSDYYDLSVLCRCCLFGLQQSGNQTRQCILKLLIQIPPNWKYQLLTSTISCVSNNYMSHMSLQSNKDVISLKCVNHDFTLFAQLPSILCDTTFMTEIDQLLDQALQLELLENTLHDERQKTNLISQLSLHLLQSENQYGPTWIHLFILQILLAQFLEKFMPLWQPTLSNLSDLISGFKNNHSCLSYTNSEDHLMLINANGKRQVLSQNSNLNEQSTQNKLGKRRRVKNKTLSSLHLWIGTCILYQLQCCTILNQSKTTEQVKQTVSHMYTNKKQSTASRKRSKGFKTLDQIVLNQKDSKVFESGFESFWEQRFNIAQTTYSMVVSGYHHEFTDSQTTHNYYSRILASLFELCSGYTHQMMSHHRNDSTTNLLEYDEIFIFQSWVNWILQWSLAHAVVLCERTSFSGEVFEVPNEWSSLWMRQVTVLTNYGDGYGLRLMDCLRVILGLGYIGKCNDLKSSNIHNRKDSLVINYPTIMLWQQLLEICLHRVILITDKTLQDLCLQIGQASHLSNSINPYKLLLNNIISDVNTSETLLAFSIDTEDTSVLEVHRDVIIPILIRLLFSKLSRKPNGSTGLSSTLSGRRKMIFRFFSQLPLTEIPILLSIICRPCFQFKYSLDEDRTNYQLTEGQKEEIIQSYLKDMLLKTDHIHTMWDISYSTFLQETLLLGSWIQQQHCFSLPMDMLQKPTRLGGLLSSIEEIVLQMRLKIKPFAVFIGEILSTILIQFGYIILKQREFERRQIKNHSLKDTNSIRQSAHSDNSSNANDVHNNEQLYNNPQINSISLIGFEIPTERLRKLIRRAFILLGKLISIYPELYYNWDMCISKCQDTLIQILKESLEGGGNSAALKFICLMSQQSQLFYILEHSLSSCIPMLCRFISSQPILCSISQGKGSGLGVQTVLTFILRLCRGGNDDLSECTREARDRKRETQSILMARKRKQRRHRGEDDSESDSDHDGSNNIISNILSKNTNEFSLEKWREELEADCLYGRKLLKPSLNILLKSLQLMLSERKSAGISMKKQLNCNAFGYHQSKYQLNKQRHQNNFQLNTFVTIQELEVITELAQFADKDSQTACELISLLLFALPPVRRQILATNSGSQRLRLVFSSVRELLNHLTFPIIKEITDGHCDNTHMSDSLSQIHTYPDLIHSTLALLSTTLVKYLQCVQDLQSRLDLCCLLLTSSLISAGCHNPTNMIELILKQFSEGTFFLSITDSEPSLSISNWMPDMLLKNNWVSSIATHDQLWSVTISIILVGLATLRPRVATVEPDFDLHIKLLVELVEHSQCNTTLAHLNETSSVNNQQVPFTKHPHNIPAKHQMLIIIQCLFIIQAQGVDVGVRNMAVKFISSIIYRIAKISAIRMKLDTVNQLTTDLWSPEAYTSFSNYSSNEIELEWRDCYWLLRCLFFSVMTTLRSLLKGQDQTSLRSSLEILSYIIRYLGPYKQYLPFITTPTPFFSSPTLHPQHNSHLILIENRFHFDLLSLMRSNEIIDSDGLIKLIALNADEGGDVFTELLHLQKHRRARGITLLSSGMQSSLIGRSTACHICMPVAMKALLQPDSLTKSSLHIGLLERGMECLGQGARLINWSDCLILVKRLSSSIHRYPSREKYLIKAICRVLTSFDFKIDDAVAKYVAASNLAEEKRIDMAQMIAESEKKEKNEIRKEQEQKKLLQKTQQSNNLTENSIEQLPRTVEEQLDSDVENEDKDLNEDQNELNDIKLVEESDTIEMKLQETAASDIISMQKSIRQQILPMLRRLSVVTKKAGTEYSAAAIVGSSKGPGALKGQKQDVVLLRPQVVSAQLQVMRYLPQHQLHASLPKLLQTLIDCLISRDTDSRRKARVSVSSIATNLGPRYFSWIIKTLATGLTKGYQVAVLIFTAVSALTQMTFGAANTAKSLMKADVLIPVGQIDDAVPVLLPLITQELDRFCDPDRPEFETDRSGGLLTRRSGIDEQKYFKSGDLVAILCRVTSFDTIGNVIFKFLYGLLTGASCENRTTAGSAAASFSRKYRNMVQSLFEQASLGVSKNPSFSTFVKLRLSYRMLRLQEIMLSGGSTTPSTSSLHQIPSDIHDEEQAFFSDFLVFDEDSMILPQAATPSFEVALNNLRKDQMKKFIVQPGAATGRSAEQMLRTVRGVDSSAKAVILGVTGLRLFYSIQGEFRTDNLFSTLVLQRKSAKTLNNNISPASLNDSENANLKTAQQLLDTTSEFIIACFCGKNDELVMWAAKCLVKLLAFRVQRIYQDGKRIALTVLQLFQKSETNASKHNITKARGLTATCTRVLAALLTDPTTSLWFNRLLSSQDTDNIGAQKNFTFSQKKKKNAITNNTFKTALLSQIRVSLDDMRLRLSALQLFRTVILLRERDANISVAEHAALVYQCVDEIAVLLVQHANQDKLSGLCGRIYVDFLMAYPMPERIQQKRVGFLIKNLSHVSPEGRRAALSVVYELLDRLPAKIVSDRYGSIIGLALVLRLAKEDKQETRQMVRVVLRRLIRLINNEGSRTHFIETVLKAFLCKEMLLRAALAEFLAVCFEYYGHSGGLEFKLNILFPGLLKCLTFSEQFVLGERITNHPANTKIISFNLPPVPSIHESDWKLAYTCLNAFQQFIAIYPKQKLCKLVQSLTDLSNDYMISPSYSFITLWRYIVITCTQHEHPWIKTSSLRILSSILSIIPNSTSVEEQASSTLIYSLFSASMLPEITPLIGKSDVIVTPLTNLLWSFTQWSRMPSAEAAPAVSDPLIQGILAICYTLISIPQLIDECTPVKTNSVEHYDYPEDDSLVTEKVNLKNGKTMQLVNDQKHTIPTQNNTSIEKNVSETGHLSSSFDVFDTETLPIDQHITDINEDNSEEEDEEEEPEKKKILNDSDDSDDNDDELLGLESIGQTQIESLQHEALEVQDTIMDGTFPDYKLFNTSSNVNKSKILDTDLQRCRIRWLVGRLTWSIKRGMGHLSQHVVRLSTALQILTGLVNILPSDNLNSDKDSLLRPIIEGLYLCATLKHDGDMGQSAEMDLSHIAATTYLSLGTNTKAVIRFIGSLGEKLLNDVQKILEIKQLDNEFHLVLQDVRLTIGKKRSHRKQHTQQLKGRDPQQAALQKLKRNFKKKEGKKKRIQKFKTLRGA